MLDAINPKHRFSSKCRMFYFAISLGAVSQLWYFLIFNSKDLRNPSEGILMTPKLAETVKDQVRKPKRSPRNVYWCGYRNMFD
jgi:hypothetical protein